MATINTNITLYPKTKLTESRHVAFDHVEDYLGAKVVGTPTTVTGVMLNPSVFRELRTTFKLNIEATTLLGITLGTGIDYIRVKVVSSAVAGKFTNYFYFVESTEWLSTSTLSFHVKLDVLSTFVLGSGILLGDHTVTRRQHKDRFQSFDSLTLKAIRAIDRFDEGLAPLQYKALEALGREESEYDPDFAPEWNVVYRNANQPSTTDYYQINPVEVHLTMDEDATVSIARTGNEWSWGTFTGTASFAYMFKTFDNGMKLTANGTTVTLNMGSAYAIVKNADGTLSLRYLILDANNQWIFAAEALRGETIVVSDYTSPYFLFLNQDPPYLTTTPGNYTVYMSEQSATLYGVLESYDRTKSELIKIVKVPYAPIAWTYTSNKYDIPGGWSFDPSFHDLKCDDPNKPFHRSISMRFGLNPLLDNLVVEFAAMPAERQNREMENESKLYASAFHTCKFVYDSFSLPIAFENAKHSALTVAGLGDAAHVSVDYTVSSTFSGNFMFEFTQYKSKFDGITEDYPFFLTVARNNQVPIFTSAYIDYIRSGYNYDVKAKNAQLAGSMIGIGASVAGGIAAAALGTNPGTAVMAAGIGIVASLMSTINSQMNSENQIQRKVDSAKMQAVTIAGSDDVDLMVEYSDNRLKYVEYEPSPAIKKSLFDLFHFCGYSCNDMGTPSLTSRHYFNFIQCDAEVIAGGNVPTVFLEEAKRLLAEGITLIHKPMADLALLDCEYENWETSLFTI